MILDVSDCQNQVTMKAIAKEAGVSLMSVSRALRNDRGISATTRNRIMDIAHRLDYRPNPLVGALMANLRRAMPKESRQTIAYITSEESPDDWRKRFSRLPFFEGAVRRADHLGFRLQDFWLNPDQMPGPRLAAILHTRGIRGAIIAPAPLVAASAFDLPWDNLSPVVLGYSLPQLSMHRVTNHQLHSMRLALAKLTAYGYRRIGLAVESQYNVRVDENWSGGFLSYQERVTAANRVPMLLQSGLNARIVHAWVKRHRPDVVVGGLPVDWLRDAGIAVPEEVGFVELNYHSSMGDIVGVDQNPRAVGAAAVDLVVEQLYNNQTGLPEIPKVVMIEGKWHSGSTLREVKAKSRMR